MKLKSVVAVLALLACGSVQADSLTTWDFSFQTLDSAYIGSGSFKVLPIPSNSTYDAYQIVSLDGTMNGSLMTLMPGINTALDGDIQFLNHYFNFSVNGNIYLIRDNDSGAPPYDNVLFGPGVSESILLTLTDPPSDVPEPSTLILLICGLIALPCLAVRKRNGLIIRRTVA